MPGPVPQSQAALSQRFDPNSTLFDASSVVVSPVRCEVIVVMASSKIQDLSREGKNLRLRISASDLSVSRLSRAFQASKCIIS